MTEEKKLFKDWFDRDAAKMLAAQVASAYPDFNRKAFITQCMRGLEKLEFQARVQQFADALRSNLPDDIPEALRFLAASLPEEVDPDSVTDGWLQWPLGHFIAAYAVDYPEEAFVAMEELTKRFSSEFAVRPFAIQYPEMSYNRLMKLTAHANPHVRRWCSEGLRPRLPWAPQLPALIADPSPVLPILNALKDDASLYVRRSVANHLNDIGKDHPEVLIRICRDWKQDSNPDRDWLIKHGLRSLIKNGNPAALSLLGFGPPKQLEVEVSLDRSEVKIGESLTIELSLHNQCSAQQDLLVDYAVEYLRKNGKNSAKVFKWKTLSLGAGGKEQFSKKQSFRITTTRALYPGSHSIWIQINGQKFAEVPFTLLP